jgi:oxygen-independent coproporphyrinogen-3 oxidase
MSGTMKVQRTDIPPQAALEESFFLGLRLNRGVSLRELAAKFGGNSLGSARAAIAEFLACRLMEEREDRVCLTARGRLLSNEVFERFMVADEVLR